MWFTWLNKMNKIENMIVLYSFHVHFQNYAFIFRNFPEVLL